MPPRKVALQLAGLEMTEPYRVNGERNAAPFLPGIPHFQTATLLAPQGVIEQRGQHGAIALALELARVRCDQ